MIKVYLTEAGYIIVADRAIIERLSSIIADVENPLNEKLSSIFDDLELFPMWYEKPIFSENKEIYGLLLDITESDRYEVSVINNDTIIELLTNEAVSMQFMHSDTDSLNKLLNA